jgi:hypothetical protein
MKHTARHIFLGGILRGETFYKIESGTLYVSRHF